MLAHLKRGKVPTIFALALLDLVFILHVLMAGLAVVPSPFHLFMNEQLNIFVLVNRSHLHAIPGNKESDSVSRDL